MYKIFNALIDKFTGFQINSELNEILKMDVWSREQIEADQKEKFHKLSEFASKSEYYKDYKGCELSEYPILEREILKTSYDRLKTNIRKPYSIHHTSGSTSSPVSFISSREMLLAKRVSHQKMLHWNGLNRESPEFKIGGVKNSIIESLYYLLKNKRYFDSFQVSLENSEKLIRKYNSFKPKVLSGYPSSISHLIQFSEVKNIPLNPPEIIVAHAENLYKEIAEKMKDTFPEVRIVNQYWASEANIAVTCPEGGLHIDEDAVICEVINEDETGVGDLLVTNLYSFDFPLIRYKIGDRVRLSNEKCSCGRNTKLIDHMEGREMDFVDLPDGRQVPVTSIYLSRYTKNVISYQLVYHKRKAMWEFLYIPHDKSAPIQKDAIIDHVKSSYGLSVSFTEVEKIRYTKGGKFKKVIVVE